MVTGQLTLPMLPHLRIAIIFLLNYQLLPGRVSPTTSGLIGSPPCLFRWDLISFPPCKHQPCFSPLSFLQFSSSGTKGLLQITAQLYSRSSYSCYQEAQQRSSDSYSKTSRRRAINSPQLAEKLRIRRF